LQTIVNCILERLMTGVESRRKRGRPKGLAPADCDSVFQVTAETGPLKAGPTHAGLFGA